MIIACPACATRYVVPDSAIGLEGRTVRCAKCKHSWYQDGPEIAVPADGAVTADRPEQTQARSPVPTPSQAPAPAADPRPHVGPSPVPAPAPAPVPAPASPPVSPKPVARYDDVGGPDADDVPDEPRFEPRFDEGDAPYDELPPTAPRPSGLDEGVSQFDYAPPFKPRRNYLKLWTWAAGLFAVLALGTVVAVNTMGLPDWVPVSRPLFAMAEPDLELAFPVEQQERRTLPNGTEFFGARIVVTNTARESRNVPPILIVLRDGRERIVYSWEVVPPQPSLAPGEAMTINEAITDVPKSAVFADIGWAPR